MPKANLTLDILKKEAKIFAVIESMKEEPCIYGITDGKAVGTYLEHKFQEFLKEKYNFIVGNSAKGIDFPQLLVDIKVTSIKQPQSSCPFKSARQKIFGLGYSLLVFVYEKTDNDKNKTSKLNILHSIFVEADRTADYQTSKGLIEILRNNGNKDDLIAFMYDKNLPADEIELNNIAEELLETPPKPGFLTISNALQWRLQYSRIIQEAGIAKGVIKLL